MKVLEKFTVPTGEIYTAESESGKFEFLSLGDYGKEKNIKANFLGFDKNINGVPHGELMPLSKKWVVTISTQPGCTMQCKFCDVWKYALVPSASVLSNEDLIKQVIYAVSTHPEITHTERLNVHYARMGEPTFNINVLDATYYLKEYFNNLKWGFHPVISTMMPKGNQKLFSFLKEWIDIKNNTCKGEAGLQLSINSTSDEFRADHFKNMSLSLKEMNTLFKDIDLTTLKGRKIALNFALDDKSIIEGKVLKNYFDPKYFMVKITPMHVTNNCIENNIVTVDGYTKYHSYENAEASLLKEGFDTLVFIPSIEEDKGRITCGNALLSGTVPEVKYTKKILNIDL